MESYEIIFYILFFIILFILAIGIYFYNKRHKNIFAEGKEIYYNHEKKDIVIEFKKNSKFDWDLYEDELKDDDRKFIGIDSWDNEKIAQCRIDEIKNEFNNNDFVLFHLVEILLLIDSYGKEVVLNDNGEFVISKLYLSSFINGLEYNIELITKLENIKQECIKTNESIEIDAKEILFIMKNAKSFGLGNVRDHTQFFQFVNKQKENIIVDGIEVSQDNYIKIIVDDSNNLTDKFSLEKENELSPKDSLSKILNTMKEEMKTESLDNGCLKVTYPDGTVIIKDGPWDIKEVITPEDLLEEVEKKTQAIGKTSLLLDDINNIIEPVSKEKLLQEVNNKKEIVKADIILEEMQEDKLLIDLEINIATNIYFRNKDGEKSFNEYFKDITSLELFDSALKNLERDNLLIFIGAVLNKNFIKKNINYLNNTKFEFNFFLTDGKKYYIVYEYFIFMLLSLIKNKNTFLSENILANKDNFSMRFPVPIVKSFKDAYKNNFGNEIFYELNEKYYFYKHFSIGDKLFKSNLLILDSELIKHLNENNPIILESARLMQECSKDEILKYKKEKQDFYSIYFSEFRSVELVEN